MSLRLHFTPREATVRKPNTGESGLESEYEVTNVVMSTTKREVKQNVFEDVACIRHFDLTQKNGQGDPVSYGPVSPTTELIGSGQAGFVIAYVNTSTSTTSSSEFPKKLAIKHIIIQEVSYEGIVAEGILKYEYEDQGFQEEYALVSRLNEPLKLRRGKMGSEQVHQIIDSHMLPLLYMQPSNALNSSPSNGTQVIRPLVDTSEDTMGIYIDASMQSNDVKLYLQDKTRSEYDMTFFQLMDFAPAVPLDRTKLLFSSERETMQQLISLYRTLAFQCATHNLVYSDIKAANTLRLPNTSDILLGDIGAFQFVNKQVIMTVDYFLTEDDFHQILFRKSPSSDEYLGNVYYVDELNYLHTYRDIMYGHYVLTCLYFIITHDPEHKIIHAYDGSQLYGERQRAFEGMREVWKKIHGYKETRWRLLRFDCKDAIIKFAKDRFDYDLKLKTLYGLIETSDIKEMSYMLLCSMCHSMYTILVNHGMQGEADALVVETCDEFFYTPNSPNKAPKVRD